MSADTAPSSAPSSADTAPPSADSTPPSFRDELLRVTDEETLARTTTMPGAPSRPPALPQEPTAQFLSRICWESEVQEQALPTAMLLRRI